MWPFSQQYQHRSEDINPYAPPRCFEEEEEPDDVQPGVFVSRASGDLLKTHEKYRHTIASVREQRHILSVPSRYKEMRAIMLNEVLKDAECSDRPEVRVLTGNSDVFPVSTEAVRQIHDIARRGMVRVMLFGGDTSSHWYRALGGLNAVEWKMPAIKDSRFSHQHSITTPDVVLITRETPFVSDDRLSPDEVGQRAVFHDTKMITELRCVFDGLWSRV